MIFSKCRVNVMTLTVVPLHQQHLTCLCIGMKCVSAIAADNVITLFHLSLPQPVPLNDTPGALYKRVIGCPQHVAIRSSWIALSTSTRILHNEHSNSYIGICNPYLRNSHVFAFNALNHFDARWQIVSDLVYELHRDFLAFSAFKFSFVHCQFSLNSRLVEG